MPIIVTVNANTLKEVQENLETMLKEIKKGIVPSSSSTEEKKPVTKPKAEEKKPDPKPEEDDDDMGLDDDDDDEPTIEQVRTALKAYRDVEGKDAAIKILKDHGASSMGDLKSDKYAEVLAAAKLD